MEIKNENVCVGRFVRATLGTASTVQDYVVHHRPMLCTTDPCCTWWKATASPTLPKHPCGTCFTLLSLSATTVVVHNTMVSV